MRASSEGVQGMTRHHTTTYHCSTFCSKIYKVILGPRYRSDLRAVHFYAPLFLLMFARLLHGFALLQQSMGEGAQKNGFG